MTESGADVKVIMDFKYVYKCVFMCLLISQKAVAWSHCSQGDFLRPNRTWSVHAAKE